MSNYDEAQKILGKLELADLVRWQINRCNVTAGDKELFNRNVEILMMMLPSTRLIEMQELSKEYKYEIDEFVFKHTRGGRQIGTVENPFYINTPDDPNYNGGTPVLVSPTKNKAMFTDYNKMYTLILRLFENAGLTWKNENVEIDGGGVDFNDEEKENTPTPTFEEEKQ